MVDTIYSCVEDYLKKSKEFDKVGTQMSPGHFLCYQRELQLPKLIVGKRYVTTSLLYQSTLQQDCFYIVIPKINGGMLVNGQKIALSQPLVFTSKQESLIHLPENACNLYIIIPTVELTKYFDEEKIEMFKHIISQCNIHKKALIQSDSDQKCLSSLIDNLLQENTLLSYQEILDGEATIMELICNLFTSNLFLPRMNKISNSTKLAIVNRALNHVHKNSAITITSPELAEISFCCLRNLEYAFKSVLNISPKQYLIKRRFQLIHSTLKSEGTFPVSEIIKSFGIVNQARFINDYFKFYKEYPQQTRDKRLEKHI